MLKGGEFDGHEQTADEFYNVMTTKKFMPNTPAIANFGAVLGMGSACFVMDVQDNIEGIMDTLKNATVVFKSGGGVGYNFSKLRPEGDFVSTTTGAASGPISFMGLFDKMTEVIKQGGIRRGANMGILNSNHPDIEKFITAKEGNKQLTNFNISVLMMPDFWEHYHKNEPYPLTNPRSGETVRTVNPRMLFDMIVYQAWESAEPGVIFYDHVNKYNPFFEHLGPIVTTNPCGEVLLYPNESCNLGSINVWAFFKEDEAGQQYFDWQDLERTTRVCSKLLDNVIDVNKFPLKTIEDMTDATRKIGLGVMGVADLLYELKLPYNSQEARDAMEKLMEFVNYHSKLESIELAKTRGPMPYNTKSFYTEGRLPLSGPEHKDRTRLDWNHVQEELKKHGSRNGYTTVIAPTGSISMIAGCSSGIEPVYALVFEKNVKVGSFYYTDPVFERIMKHEGLYDAKLMEDVSENKGSVSVIPYLTPEQKRVFVTAMDILPEDHIRMLAAFQKWTDSSISKTNNFPADATVEDMRESYLLAYELGCKDVTVYRDSSIKQQVLNAPKKKEQPSQEVKAQPHAAPVAQTPPVVAQVPPLAATAVSSNTTMYQGHGSQPNAHVSAPTPGLAPTPNMTAQRTATMQQPKSKFEIKQCPNCNSNTQIKEGCVACPECGWGVCN
jgi:ribonucleoside-diphosphate reductase alpha chain